MTTKSLEYKWITEVHKNVQDFWFFTKQDGARSTFANWAFQLFHFTVRAQVCSLARWLSHMGAPLLDYFPPSDGNLSPLKDFLPLFLVRSVLPSILHGRFRLKRFISAPHFGSVQIVTTTLSCTHTGLQKMWNCDFIWITWNYQNFWPSILNSSLFSEKIVFNKDMSFSLKVVILHIYSLVVWN